MIKIGDLVAYKGLAYEVWSVKTTELVWKDGVWTHRNVEQSVRLMVPGEPKSKMLFLDPIPTKMLTLLESEEEMWKRCEEKAEFEWMCGGYD